MAKIITMTIDDEGNPTIDLEGYHGKGCDAVQQAFGAALGKTTKAVKKPEYHKPVSTQNTLKQR